MHLAIAIEDFVQALVAGLLVGAVYGLMCVGLGLIFGVMRVINFAQGDFLMLGMYFSLYVVSGLGALAVFGPEAAPIAGALLAGPALFAGGWLLAPAAAVAGHRHPGRRQRGRRPCAS